MNRDRDSVDFYAHTRQTLTRMIMRIYNCQCTIGAREMAVKKDVRVYPAILYKDGECVGVRFPDLPGCVTFGSDYQDAIASAKDALGGHLLCLEEDGDSIPSPTPVESLSVRSGDIPVLVDVRLDILREKESNKSVNKNVTIPAWLNSLATEAKINFSQALQDSLRARLGV